MLRSSKRRIAMRRLWLTMLVLVLGYGAPALSAAEASLTHGMVIDVEEGQRVLILETRAGRREISIVAGASIHDHHGQLLMLQDIRPGDAVAYRGRADGVTDLRVVRQFWAIPADE
jgi:hypothetical protein